MVDREMMCRNSTEPIPVVSAGIEYASHFLSEFYLTRAPGCGFDIVKNQLAAPLQATS